MFLLEVLIILTASRAACMALADSWTNWSACTKTCGGGYRTRYQWCHYLNGTIHLCYPQREACETQHCPITVLAHWSEWSSCSVTCGTGESVRHWVCPAQTALIGKRSTCTEHSERQKCSSGLCPIADPWSSWSTCTKTCEGGYRNREKMCHYLNGPSFVCDTQRQICETQHCPITVPAHWSEWSSCSATCGTGESTRHWICATVTALIGKRSACTEHLERQTCSSRSCPIDGHWGSWLEWSKCPVTCGAHSQNRHRVCNNPVPSNGGQPCAGSPTGSRHCPISACPVDGHWGSWSEWSQCPVTCGTHSQNRHRSCNNPAPSNGGRSCVGSTMESQNCSLSACPVDGHWGSWSEWSKCPVTCGSHLQNRHRACNNPAPSNRGRPCVGSNIESQNCSLSACPVDGHWGSWSEWSKCPVTCGGHLQNRHRACNNPAPSIGGRSCVGSDMESQNCSLSACPVDGHWGSWSEWSKCPVTCGGHSQNRHRACNNPAPSNRGRSCLGSDMESQNCSLSACPVDGHWGSWSEWSKCPVTCGSHLQNRHRSCNNPVPSNGGRSCVGSNIESQNCSLSACPVDGHWGSWSEWSKCPVTCGSHLQNRHRSCNNPAPSNGGRPCVGPNIESHNCSLSACPVDGHWGSWSEWSKCPVTCGGHSQNRHRACNNPAPSNRGRSCLGSDMESQNCSLSACPVDGHWGSWSEWSKCPVTCGSHLQNRHRSCNNPVPSNGGRSCVGSNIESQNCSLSACPVDGHWGSWSEWSKCPVTCGSHLQNRHRSCNNPAPSNGGRPCVGPNIESHNCSLSACPVDGHWGSWSEWSQCPVTCGGHLQNRHRSCNNPVPSNGGRSCVGSDMESLKCSLSACPVDGHWGSWSEWSKCPVTCGSHLQNRHRSCNNPVPSNGGRPCVGSNMESQNCSLSACPVDGHWGSWSEWSKCPVTCGGHLQNRHRACNNPAPSNGGRSCVGSTMESQNCSLSACPVDGHWGSWSEWSQCPVTCGGHSQNRHRACNNPVPSNGGRLCEGSDMESQNCSLSACPVDGKWSGWSGFSKCSVSCGLGTQIRSRSCSNPAPSNGGLDCLGLSIEALICSFPACVPEPRVCDKVRLLSSISHNNSFSQNGNSSCTDPSYQSSRALIRELCNAPSTSLHISSQVIDVCNQALAFSPVVRKDDITGNTDYGILIECHGNQLKVASQDCTNNIHILDLNGPESDKYYVVDW